MKIGDAFKLFQLNILKQAGVAVTPQQLGLKSDPIADLQAQNTTGTFGNILGRLSATGQQGMTPPTLPTPPADPLDADAQSKYQQELLAYHQNFQLYQQRFMQMVMQQMNAMQQTMMNISRDNGQNQTRSIYEPTSGVGGILGGTADV